MVKITGNVILYADAANLFDAVGGMLGLETPEQNPGLRFLPNIGNNNNQFPNFNNNFNKQPNNNKFPPNPNFNPNFNNNGGMGNNNNFGRLPPNNNNNINRLPNNNINRPPINNNNGQIFIDRQRDQTGNKNEFGLTEEERLATQKFPGIRKLLDELRELNRQRDLQKQKENGQNGFNNGWNGNNNNMNANFNNGNQFNGNGNYGRNEYAMNGWKIMRKRKFLFQAKPVRPDNEIVSEDEKVYYFD